MQRRQHPRASGTRGVGGTAAAAASGIERTVGGGSASRPGLLLLFLPLLPPPPNSQSLAPALAQPPRAPGGTGEGRTAPCWVGSQPPWIATTRWWRKPWKVQQDFLQDPGVGIGSWGGKLPKSGRSATRGAEPEATLSLSGWRVARLRRGLHCLHHAAGSTRGAAGPGRGMGVRGPG